MTTDDRAKFEALTDAKPQAQQGYRCGHCGYEGPCYGQPTSSGVSAPWCKQCGMNNKLSALASAQAASAEPVAWIAAVDLQALRGQGSGFRTVYSNREFNTWPLSKVPGQRDYVPLCTIPAPAVAPAAVTDERAVPLQGGMSNDDLVVAFQRKLPGVKPTDNELSAFAIGVEVGFARAIAPEPQAEQHDKDAPWPDTFEAFAEAYALENEPLTRQAMRDAAANAFVAGWNARVRSEPQSDSRGQAREEIAADKPAQQQRIAIRCPEKLKNGGVCPHHNLQCGWPQCNEEQA